jgi:hypothetical protein
MKCRHVTLLASLLFSTPWVAQAQQPVQPAPEAEPTEGIDDYVVVQGWRHPVQLRMRMVEAELAVYDLFNQFNDDASLRLECFKRTIGGTRLQTTDCAPRFESQALAEEGRDALEVMRAYLNGVAMSEGNFAPGAQNDTGRSNTAQFINYAPTTMGRPADLMIKAGQGRLQDKMDEIAAEHPEFVEAVVEYVESKTRYTESLRRDRE